MQAWADKEAKLRPMIAAIWIVAALGLGLWTLCLWAAWVLLSWRPDWVMDLKLQLDQWPVGNWLSAWWPDWESDLMRLLNLVHQLLGFAMDWLPWVLGSVWLLGTLVGLGLAGLLHALVRESGPAPQPS